MRVEWAVHQRLAGTNPISFLNVDVCTTRNIVLSLFQVIASNNQFAFTLSNRTQLNETIDFRHDRRLRGPASFKQLDDAWQTAGDVFRLRGLTRNLRNDVARLYRLAIGYHQVCPHRHLVSLQDFVGSASDFETRLLFLVRRVFHYESRLTSYFVNLFVESYTFFQILELNMAGNFRKDCESKWIPRRQQLILRNPGAIFNQNVGAIDYLITRRLATAVIHNNQ